MKQRQAHITSLAAALILAAGIGPSLAAEQPPGPEGLVGFSGQVRGVVVKKRDNNVIEFKVARILQTWANNKAQRPEALKGRTIPVGPTWKQEGEGGKWHPVETHARFLKSLESGEELTLEIRHAEREHFAILELSKKQRERAARGRKVRHEKQDDREAEIAELRREIERLKAENRELRKNR